MSSPSSRTARGRFTVKMTPFDEAPGEGGGSAVSLGRLKLEKQFSGDLEGEGRGQMLTAMTGTQGSAGYVAIEHFSGSLHGRRGGFVFQHSGLMERGTQQLTISVVPDSGHGELSGIAGRFSIAIVEGQHRYEFDYSLPG